MNKYQKSIDELKLDENAKRRIFHRVSQNWDDSREYRLRFERMRTANICLSVFLAIFCVSNVAMAVVIAPKTEAKKITGMYSYVVPIGVTCESQDTINYSIEYYAANGSFCWNEVAVAKTIQAGDTVYQSRKDYFLICKLTVDLDHFYLPANGCGISFTDPFSYANGIAWSEYRDTFMLGDIEGEWPSELDYDNPDLNLSVTKALSVDMHVGWNQYSEVPPETRGVCYLCFDIDQDYYDYFYFNYIAKTEGIEGIRRIGTLPKFISQATDKTLEEEIEAWQKSFTWEWRNWRPKEVIKSVASPDIHDFRLCFRTLGKFVDNENGITENNYFFCGEYQDFRFLDSYIID